MCQNDRGISADYRRRPLKTASARVFAIVIALLDGRLFSTFVDGGGNAIACTAGVCLVGLHVSIVWQAEFTAGVILRLP